MISRRFLCACLLALGLVSLMPRLAGAAEPDAKVFVEGLAERAIASVAAPNLPEEEKLKNFRQLFVTAFDLPEIGKFVLGRYWRTASDTQRQDFLAQFEEYTVLTWARRFKDYKGETLSVINVVNDPDKGILVDSQINRPAGQPPTPVGWVLAASSDGFRVRDITVEGVSLAQTNRSDISSVVQANGGSLEGLNQTLKQKIAKLGTP